LKSGKVAEHELRSAQANLVAIKMTVADLTQQRAILTHQLGLLTNNLALNIPADERFLLPNIELPPMGLPSALLSRRPDILQAEEKLIAANAKIGVARAAIFPSISLTGLLGGESKELSSLLGAPARIWSLGFALNLPIFDGGKLSARLEAAKAQEQQALIGYQRAVQNAFRDVNDALATLRQTNENIQQQTERLSALTRIQQLVTARFSAGQISQLEVLEQERLVLEAHNNLIRSKLTNLKASVDFIKALGGGWQGDGSAIPKQ
jgi:outer membrane protein, multidrug efflux system